MKESLAMALFSRRILTEQVATEQIQALSNFRNGIMRPDKFSEYDPIQTPFCIDDIAVPVKGLSDTHGTFFYRKGNPPVLSGEIWNRTHPPDAKFPSPLFVTRWTGRFDLRWVNKMGTDLIQQFVSELVRVCRSDFGFLTTQSDYDAKNTNSASYSYQGLDLELGFPGLYWLNFFSEEAANLLGLRSLPREIAEFTELPGTGCLVKFCDSPEACRDDEVLKKQNAAKEWLGSDFFFDISDTDRKLRQLNWSLPEE